MRRALIDHGPDSATGVVVLDYLHHQLDAALRATLAADDISFVRRFHELVAILEEAFAKEESWMEEVDYPAIKSHREQHARVLSGMHHVNCSLMEGNVGLARKVVAVLLPDWLKLHVATMDTALAMYLQACGMPETETPLFA
ncbi:MAG: hemerythrin domain-containing protein [Noviherbaspirillum sp.]